MSAMGTHMNAHERAEKLLLGYLTPEQAMDWRTNVAFNLRGSSGTIWRLSPLRSPSNRAVMSQDGLGLGVWPVSLGIHADWALAMMLYLQADEAWPRAVACHEWYLSTSAIHDYGGKL